MPNNWNSKQWKIYFDRVSEEFTPYLFRFSDALRVVDFSCVDRGKVTFKYAYDEILNFCIAMDNVDNATLQIIGTDAYIRMREAMIEAVSVTYFNTLKNGNWEPCDVYACYELIDRARGEGDLVLKSSSFFEVTDFVNRYEADGRAFRIIRFGADEDGASLVYQTHR